MQRRAAADPVQLQADCTSEAASTSGHRWRPGQSGNPAGKRPGTRNRILAALDKIANGAAEEVLRTAVQAALAGDLRATQLILDRAWPVRKGRPVALSLPTMQAAADLPAALAALLGAVAAGELTPDEGQAVAGMLELHRKAIETADLDRRMTAIEKLYEDNQT